MKTKDIFSLAIRLLGLVFLYHGLQAFPAAAALFVSAFPNELAPELGTSRLFSALFMVGWPFLLAHWLVRGAPLLLRIAYPDASTREQRVEAVTGAKADA